MSGLDLSVLGKKFPEKKFSYTNKDVILYALGIGAQIDELSFIYEGVKGGLKVFPSFATIARGVAFPNLGRIVFPKFIHGEESVKIFKPFKSQGEIICFSEVTNIFDKGKGAVVHVLFTGLTTDREKLFEVKSVFFYLGAGGFGGDRGPKTKILEVPKDRKPDFSLEYQTMENQAALYRLNGDRNPLHIDPDAAKLAGQSKPILHGLCTFGFATRAIIHQLCNDDVSRFKEFKVRFANVVYPGESLRIEGWEYEGKHLIQARTKRSTVLNNAYAVIK